MNNLRWVFGSIGIAVCVLMTLALHADPASDVAVGEAPAAPLLTWPQRRQTFYDHFFVDLYQAHGQRDPRWDAPVESLLRDYCRWMAYEDEPDEPRPADAPDYADLEAQRDAVRATGCDDPLAVMVCAMVDHHRRRNWNESDVQTIKHLAEWAKERELLRVYAVTLRILQQRATRELHDGHHSNQKWENQEWVAWANRWAYTIVDDTVTLTPVDQSVIARMFNDYMDDIDIALAAELMTATVQPPAPRRWLAHVMRAKLYVETAWNARGNGYANTVNDEGWKRFAGFLAQARSELEAAWTLDPTQAEAAVSMLTVSLGEGGDDLELWFQRAAAADPSDDAPYHALLWARRPRWYGNYEMMFDVGLRALDTGRFDTAVPDQFDALLGDLLDEDAQDWLRAHADRVWPAMQRYIAGRAAGPTPRRSTDWAWSRGLGFAFLFGHLADARACFDQLGRDSSRMAATQVFGLDKRWDVGWLYAQDDPAALEAIDRSLDLSDASRHLQAADVLDAAADKAQDSWTQTHLRDRARVQRWVEDFDAGRWVDLLEHGLEGWRPTRGEWNGDPAGGVTGRYTDPDGLRLICGLRPGTRYEAEIQLTLPPLFHTNNGWGGVGFILDPELGVATSDQYMVAVARWKSRVVWIQDPSNRELDDQRLGQPFKGSAVTLRLERWDAALRVTVDGQVMVERYDLCDPWPSDGTLGVAAWMKNPLDAFVFPSVRIRRLWRSPFEAAQPAAPGML